MSPQQQKSTVTNLEKAYLIYDADQSYTCCEMINFMWTKSEVREFVRLWQDGVSLETLCETLRRSENDVAMLVMDQRIKGRIKPRKRGLWG